VVPTDRDRLRGRPCGGLSPDPQPAAIASGTIYHPIARVRRYPKIGQDPPVHHVGRRATDGSLSAQLEHTIAATRDACEILTAPAQRRLTW
jgi:hypothetical protein